MTTPAPETIERERDKLYVTDAELKRRLGVPEPLVSAIVRELDVTAGFPRKQKVFGDRRYWPAVKAYFDRMNGVQSEIGAARVAPERTSRNVPPRRPPVAEPLRRGTIND